MSLLKQKLRGEKSSATSSFSGVKPTPAPVNNPIASEAVNKVEALEQKVIGLGRQLEDFYKSMEYLASAFPGKSIYDVVDIAKASEGVKSLGEANFESNHAFIDSQTMAKLPTLTQEQADWMQLGLIEVNDEGNIKIYNQFEADFAGLSKKGVIGKNFFSQVAPCTYNNLFHGKFVRGIESGTLDEIFDYTFSYKMRPTAVSICMFREKISKRNFIFVKPLD